MSATNMESELRVREEELIIKLNASPVHSVGTALEAIALGIEMGKRGIETALLKDEDTLKALQREIPHAPYPALVRCNVAQILVKRLNIVLQNPSLEVDTQVVKELTLASAILGDLRGRTKLG